MPSRDIVQEAVSEKEKEKDIIERKEEDRGEEEGS